MVETCTNEHIKLSTTSPKKASGTRRPLERIMRIHEMVCRSHFPNCSTIAKELEVNRKTIQRDINFMRDELDLPVAYSESNHGYHYTRPVSEFPFLKTTAEDLVSLILARNALDPLRGSALEATLRSGFQKLQATMSEQVTIPWSDLDQAFSVKSKGMAERDLFLFNRLAEAVLESREIRFEYRKLNSSQSEKRKLQPYHLAEIDGGWYVIGLDLDRDAKRTFAVQRMKGVHVTQKKFIRPRDFKLEDHFAGSFGVWAGSETGKEVFQVKIRFTGFAARIVSERRWHPSQDIQQLDGKEEAILLTMELSALEDVARWVLGFGAQAEAVAPPEFRDMVSRELKDASNLYK
ncbi:MAG: transcriptional regulator [Verrucomicrobiales bacterium]|nr:transcriptional regulator [Verrucomicrobiales bacterium]